ncbi:hypothetical protein, partial [Streptomyces hainanensis]
GQWVGMGGLIRAATTGRFTAQFLCDEFGLPFRPSLSDGGGGRSGKRYLRDRNLRHRNHRKLARTSQAAHIQATVP